MSIDPVAEWTLHKRKVLVPFDFSHASRKALEVARSFVPDLGRPGGGEVAVIHVINPPPVTAPGRLLRGPFDEERAIVVPRVAAPVVAPTATATPVATFAAASTSTATATAAAPSTTTSTAGGRTVRATRPPVDIDAEFDRLYARGVEELLAKRYREAFDTLSLARAIRSTASIEANLKRLRELGVA